MQYRLTLMVVCSEGRVNVFQVSDGRYRLQIVIEQLVIEDCNVRLSIFNGHGVNGYYLVRVCDV